MEIQVSAFVRQMYNFGRVLKINTFGVGQTRINGDFQRDLNDGNTNGS